jgi:hypothetical protein
MARVYLRDAVNFEDVEEAASVIVSVWELA